MWRWNRRNAEMNRGRQYSWAARTCSNTQYFASRIVQALNFTIFVACEPEVAAEEPRSVAFRSAWLSSSTHDVRGSRVCKAMIGSQCSIAWNMSHCVTLRFKVVDWTCSKLLPLTFANVFVSVCQSLSYRGPWERHRSEVAPAIWNCLDYYDFPAGKLTLEYHKPTC